MPLKYFDLFQGKIDNVKIAIARLRQFEPPEGYYLAFSGGKDSIVLKKLADLAKVKYDIHYNNTTIDPPELIYFIRKHHSDVIFSNPEMPFLRKLETKGFPLRQRRWCCEIYKESGGTGRVVLTGIRWQESARRKKRQLVETCFRDTTKRYLHPIIDWQNTDIWDFISLYHLPYCCLYDQGWKRIGCLFCPMTYKKQRIRECFSYPGYVRAFLRSFARLYAHKKKINYDSVRAWKDGDEMFRWWIAGDQKKPDSDQTVMFE